MYKLIKTFPNLGLLIFAFELQNALKNCETVLDVGCGTNSPLSFIPKKKFTVGVDNYLPAIKESKKKGVHNKYIKADIKEIAKLIPQKGFKKFDAVIALDVIEHLKKKDGQRLLQNMEKLATKKIILNTPNGFIPQFNKDNKLQSHLSGWNYKDFRDRGYKVVGMYGIKQLRGEEASIKYWPKPLWVLISVLTHFIYSRWNPKSAFSLFVVKSK